MATSPASLLVSGATGWHTGNQTLTYSFIGTTMPSYYPFSSGSYNLGSGSLPAAATYSMTPAERALAELAVQAWNDVANVNMVAGAVGVGDIAFGAGSFADTGLYGFVSDFPGTVGTPSPHGDVWVNHSNTAQAAAAYGNDGWQTFLHELGHGIGLHHPDEDPNNNAGDPTNNNQYTVMSYRPHPGSSAYWPVTPMLYDIAAIQQLYGANFSTRTGNTTYIGPGGVYALENGGNLVGTSNVGILTIWDAGGTDEINASNQTSAVSINLNPGTFSTIGSVANNVAIAYAVTGGGGVIVNYIENATGGSAGDTLRGNAIANTLQGGAGIDSLLGEGGADLLYGGSEGDTLNGGLGGDNLWGGLGADSHIGGDDAGIDYARYDDANYGNLTIRLDAPSGNAGAAAVGDTYTGIEGLVGGAGVDVVVGNNSNNYLFGNGATDYIYGLGGADYLNGGTGGDQLYGGAGADTHIGGDDSGIDYARYDDANYGNLTIRLDASGLNTGAAAGDTYTGIEGLVGGLGNDTVVGNASNNYLFGGGGADLIYGLGGADYLNGGNGGDNLWGGAGADAHIGGDDAGIDYARYDDANYGNLTIRLDAPSANAGAAAVGDTYTGIEGLVGGAGVDVVVGNTSANYLFGGGNTDYLYGASGNDYLNGGAGADRFVFNTALNASTNVDTIADFAVGVDDIQLSTSIFASIGATLTADELRAGTVAVDANDFILYNSATGRLYYDADGSGATFSAIQFATVTVGTALTTGDFLIA